MKASFLGFSIFAMLSALHASAQYAVKWYTMDGGGGTSTAGVYCIRGTIGQPDASAASANKQYSVPSGFWAGVTILQTSGAPLLSIRLLPEGQAVLSWPIAAAGFTLEEAESPGGPWTDTPEAVVDSESNHTVTVPASGTVKLFRLKKKK